MARSRSNVRRYLRNPNIVIGGIIIGFFILVAILAPGLLPYDPYKPMVRDRLDPPGPDHWLGTDHLGRDILTRIIHGLRLSILVGVTVVLLSSVAGVLLGLIGGYSERYGNLIMRLIDGIMAFPGLILALALVAVLEARLENIIIALAVVYTPRVARVVHSIVLSTKSTEFVSAAVAIGASTPRILSRHLFPMTIGPVVVQASFLFAGAVLAEASLSFLGVGLPPGTPSLGVILSEGRVYLMSAPWMIIFPGVLLFIISMGLNILGDGARDLLDPRYRSGT